MDQPKRLLSATSSPGHKARLWGRIYAAAAMAVALATIVLKVAFSLSGDKGSELLWLEIGKLCAQFLILVVLGVLVSYTVDQLKANNADERAAHVRQEAHVRRLIDITHDVDLGRLLIFANRSVKSWSEQMERRIIPAYTEMRDLSHDLKTAKQAGRPLFADWAKILFELLNMNEWLKNICLEFAERRGEAPFPLNQDDEWEAMLKLPLLGDFVQDKDQYGAFRDTYRSVLASMRQELAARSPRTRLPDFTLNDVMKLHALNMTIWQAVSNGNRAVFGSLVASPSADDVDAAYRALQDRLRGGAPRPTQILSVRMANGDRAILTRTIGHEGQCFEVWEFARDAADRQWRLGCLKLLEGNSKLHDNWLSFSFFKDSPVPSRLWLKLKTSSAAKSASSTSQDPPNP